MTPKSLHIALLTVVLSTVAPHASFSQGTDAAPNAPVRAPETQPTTTPAPLEGYAANRQQLDASAREREELLRQAAAVTDAGQARPLLARAVACWPPTPDAKRAALRLAAAGLPAAPVAREAVWRAPLCGLPAYHLTQPRGAAAQPPSLPPALTAMTLHYLLSVFDASGDRTRPGTTILPDNQAALNAISTAGDADLLTAAMRLLARVDALGKRGPRALLESGAEAAAKRWRGAERLGYEGDAWGCARALLQVGQSCPDSMLRTVARLAAAQWLQGAGHYYGLRGAEGLYLEACAAEQPIRERAQVGLADLAFACGRYGRAGHLYGQVLAQTADSRLYEWSRLRRGRCLEFLGQSALACADYGALAHGQCAELAAQAQYSLQRLDRNGTQASAASSEASETAALYLGEDRATGGYWPEYYGSEAFILCAQQSPDDICGGPLPLAVVAATGKPDECARRWVSPTAAEDRYAVYNPLAQRHVAANWDDRGEAYERGTGPDLTLEVSVPAGEHRLSLYLVNDRNYYEPSRVYTVIVSDEQDRYLTGAEVRWFVNGVYEQFAVRGPRRLRLRICRDLSMNVLLSGVFLDPLEARPAAGAPNDLLWGAWQRERARHLSALDERSALDEAVAASAMPAERLLKFLKDLSAQELRDRRYGPATWAAEARARVLDPGSRELAQQLLAQVEAFAVPVEVRAPGPVPTCLVWPFVKRTFERYLRAEAPRSGAGADFYRKLARTYQGQRPQLAAMAYAALVESCGEQALTPDDHYQLTTVATDVPADTIRLERALAATQLPNRLALQMQLLGRYLCAGQTAKAESLVSGIRSSQASSTQAANALYILGVYHFGARRMEAAKACLGEVVASYPRTPWSAYAERYLQRLGRTPATP